MDLNYTSEDLAFRDQVRAFLETELPSDLQHKIKELETQLKDANQKAQLFEAMLEVIRKEYGVKLPKKPSGESSSKDR